MGKVGFALSDEAGSGEPENRRSRSFVCFSIILGCFSILHYSHTRRCNNTLKQPNMLSATSHTFASIHHNCLNKSPKELKLGTSHTLTSAQYLVVIRPPSSPGPSSLITIISISRQHTDTCFLQSTATPVQTGGHIIYSPPMIKALYDPLQTPLT